MKYVRFSFLVLVLSSFNLLAKNIEVGETGLFLKRIKHVRPGVYKEKVEKQLQKLKAKKKGSLIKYMVGYVGDELVHREKKKKLSEYEVFKEYPGDYRQGEGDLTTVMETPLIFAARMVRTSLFELLLEYGADSRKPNSIGQTAAMAAAKSGAVSIIDILLDNGLNPNEKAAYSSRTALHYALKGKLDENKHAVAMRLLKAGASSMIEDRGFKTAMTEAIRLCNDELVTVMLANGYDVNFRTSPTQRVPYRITDKSTGKVREDNKREKTNVARTALMEALERYRDDNNSLTPSRKKGLKKVIDVLVNVKGLKLNLQDSDGLTYLMYAVRAKDLETVKTLIERGADDKIRTAAEDGTDVYELALAESTGEINAYLNKIKELKEKKEWFPREELGEDYY